MSQNNASPISIIALRAENYSPENESIVISLMTKYSTLERKYSVPIECFRDLIVDLQRLNATAGEQPGEASAQPPDAQNSDEKQDQLKFVA
jgi:hypothetical protein